MRMVYRWARNFSRSYASWGFGKLAPYNQRKQYNCECGYGPPVFKTVEVESFYGIKLERREEGISGGCSGGCCAGKPGRTYIGQQTVVYKSLKQ